MGDSVGTTFEEDFWGSVLKSYDISAWTVKLFDKSPHAMDKTAMFDASANPNNFAQQAAATNIQPTTLLLLFSITLYASSRLWDDFAACAYSQYGDMGDADDEFGSTFLSTPKTTPKPVPVTPPILPNVKITSVDQTVTPKTSQKKDKQKARVIDDKQTIHQSFTANPDVQTSAQKPLFLGRKLLHLGLHIY
jgi:hypothetical protein